MLSTVDNKIDSCEEVPVVPGVDLRALRNKFSKISTGELSAEDMSALLLYFALAFIENKRDLATLFEVAVLSNKKLAEFTESELALLGNKFLGLLHEFLPKNLSGIMAVPDTVSWHRASQFFKKQSENVLFSDIANLGFAYQIFSSSNRKEKALPALQKANKRISKKELISFTQLYTPGWVVDFLIANTILHGRESDKVSSRYLRWLIDDQNDIKEKNAIELESFTLIDPACGAGQFIFSAFDLLSELYEINGYSKQEAAQLILSRNIFAADIDEKALWVVALGLLSKYLIVCDSVMSMPNRLSNLILLKASDINIEISENDFLGSIDNRLPDNHLLKNNYSVVVTNPPYIGRRCLSREIKKVLKEQYPNSCADLSAAFLQRCLAMLKPEGKFGVITQSSVMSIPSYTALRNYLLENYHVQAAIQCGPGVFTLVSGEKIDSILLFVRAQEKTSKQQLEKKTYFLDLKNEKNKALMLEEALNNKLSANKNTDGRNLLLIDQSEFTTGIPHNLLRQLSASFFKKINKLTKLAGIADIRQGLATTDNGRFVRYHFDVDEELIGKTWVPYVKGAGSERYVSDNPFVVKWGDNGREIKEAVAHAYPYLKGKIAWVVKNEEFYFRSGLCFSLINKNGLAVRRLPSRAIFDVASSAIFTSPQEEDFLLAYLNSQVIGLLAKAINQTINIQVGDLKKIPIIPLTESLRTEISRLGNLAFETKKALLDCSLILPKSQKLSAADLTIIVKKYMKEQAKLEDKLYSVQTDIDNKVMDGMENSGLIDSAERKILESNNTLLENLAGTEKQCAYKVLCLMVSNLVSASTGDKLILIPSVNKNSLAKLFDLTEDGIDWLENKLGSSLERILQAKIVDINKLVLEPSRYFSFYIADHNACMLFSSAAARRFKRDRAASNIFIANEEGAKADLLKK